MLLAGVPPGALLIKIGGSSAGASDGVVKVAGSTAMIQIDEKTSGPIFLTINDAVSGLADNKDKIEAAIAIFQLPVAEKPAKAEKAES